MGSHDVLSHLTKWAHLRLGLPEGPSGDAPVLANLGLGQYIWPRFH